LPQAPKPASTFTGFTGYTPVETKLAESTKPVESTRPVKEKKPAEQERLTGSARPMDPKPDSSPNEVKLWDKKW
jgi:hypothetical protein